MVLEWWMIFTIGIFWIVSILSFGKTSYNQGSIVMLAKLHEQGYIQIDDEGNLTGLCDLTQKDQDNFTQSEDKE
jgi:hypothetical protein